MSHDGRLLQPEQSFAQQPADQHQHDELNDEDRFGGALAAARAAVGGPAAAALASEHAATDGKSQRAIDMFWAHRDRSSGTGLRRNLDR